MAKKVPVRTCIVCGQKASKRELIRIVRTPDGVVEVDPAGRKPGRGAYLCSNPECWQQATRGGRLGHVLRTAVTPQDRERLAAYGARLTAPSSQEEVP